jgi:hypothetical protein
MTQDQYGQARGPGYIVRDDAVPDDENEGYETGQSKPRTAFQKVASALRGDNTDRDEADQGQPTANPTPTSSEEAAGSGVMAPNSDASGANPPWVTERDEAAMTNSPISREAQDTTGTTGTRAGGTAAAADAGPPRGDYWDEPGAAERDEADHPATEPDMFGTTTHAGNGATSAPYSEGQRGGATIADVPTSGTSPADVPADEATGTAGRHAAAAAEGQMRPGEAAGRLGDFSDLTYGDLIPDATQFAAQWQQIQFRFVDDPRGSVTEAADVVAQVTAKLEAAIQERQRAIEERQRVISERQRSLRGRWGEGTNADTEALRETLRLYKTFLDQLIGPRAG